MTRPIGKAGGLSFGFKQTRRFVTMGCSLTGSRPIMSVRRESRQTSPRSHCQHDGPLPLRVGYRVSWQVLNAVNFRVSQNRKHVVIVGSRDDVDFLWPRPTNQHEYKVVQTSPLMDCDLPLAITLNEAISDLLSYDPNHTPRTALPSKVSKGRASAAT